MQLRLTCVTARLPHLLAHDFFMPMTAYGTNAIPLGPKCATPQTLFDRRHTMKHLARRATFDDLDNRGRTLARHGWHEKRDMILVGTNF